MITRTAWHDFYVDDDEAAVMVGSEVIVVSAVAARLLQAVGTGATLAALTAVLVEAFGAPETGDADALTRAAVDELVAHGVLAES